MRIGTIVAVLLLGVSSVGAQSSRIPGDGGDIVVTPIVHASVQIEYDGTVVHVDPWSAGDLSRAKPADLILVTDDPGHHLDPVAIEQLRKNRAPVVLTATAHERYTDGIVLANGERGTFAGIEVEAVAGYDMTPGQPWHPKGEANGYVVTLGGKRLFFSGVGECVPEIQALSNIDVAFMPMNLPVDRMRPRPVAECVKTFSPDIVFLYHYDNGYAGWLQNPDRSQPNSDTQDTLRAFEEALAGQNVEFRDGNWYPPINGQ